MKILVTGGAGFIGSNIVDGYIKSGHSVVVLDNLSSGKKEFIHPDCVFHQADIRDTESVRKIIESEKPEIINHHAAQISVRNSVANPKNDAEVNIIGLLNVLEAAKSNGISKVIFASSGGVIYGDTDMIPTSEDYQPLLPISPYGVSKLASEKYLHFYYKNYKIPYVALRYSNVYGPRQNPHGEAGVVAIFNLRLLQNQQLSINGDGKQTRDYVYVGDVVEANLKATRSSYVGSVNIGTGIETDVNELSEKIQQIYNSSSISIHNPAKEGEQRRSCLDNTLAREKLGWQPKMNLMEGLRATKIYFKEYENKRNKR